MPPKSELQFQCQCCGRCFPTLRGRSQHQRRSDRCELPVLLESATDEVTNLINAARDADDVQRATTDDNKHAAAAVTPLRRQGSQVQFSIPNDDAKYLSNSVSSVLGDNANTFDQPGESTGTPRPPSTPQVFLLPNASSASPPSELSDICFTGRVTF